MDINYLADTEVSGVINYTKLDENSYKQFGFKNPESTLYKEYMPLSFTQISEDELRGCSPVEKTAFRMFSGESHRWINDTLYGVTSVREGAEDQPDYFTEDSLSPGFHHGTLLSNRTVKRIKEMTAVLDEGLKKTPHQPRILYRGMKATSLAYGDLEASAWVKQNLSLGKEMVFDGYQSTSSSQNIANDYCGEGGIMYEILTPEGANIASVSKYEDETEVLLPRKSRYMVVGLHENVTAKDVDNNPYTMTVVQMIAIDENGSVLNSQNHHQVAPLSVDDVQISD